MSSLQELCFQVEAAWKLEIKKTHKNTFGFHIVLSLLIADVRRSTACIKRLASAAREATLSFRSAGLNL